jgi:hypothetical protein
MRYLGTGASGNGNGKAVAPVTPEPAAPDTPTAIEAAEVIEEESRPDTGPVTP